MTQWWSPPHTSAKTPPVSLNPSADKVGAGPVNKPGMISMDSTGIEVAGASSGACVGESHLGCQKTLKTGPCCWGLWTRGRDASSLVDSVLFPHCRKMMRLAGFHSTQCSSDYETDTLPTALRRQLTHNVLIMLCSHTPIQLTGFALKHQEFFWH